MAGNLDPLTPTMLSLPTCNARCKLSVHEEPAGGASLPKTTEVEQGETDDLPRLPCGRHGVIDDISFYQHTHADLTGVKNA